MKSFGIVRTDCDQIRFLLGSVMVKALKFSLLALSVAVAAGLSHGEGEPTPLYESVARWTAKCQMDFDLRVAQLDPIGPEIVEPQRPEKIDEGTKDQTMTDDAALMVSNEPLDRLRIEGMTGPYSPRAYRARIAARSARAENISLRQSAARDLEACIRLAPKEATDGVCPQGYFPKNTASDQSLCHPPPPPPVPLPSPPMMSTNWAYENAPVRPIRVAFMGGTTAMRAEIRAIAQEWADATNGPIGYREDGSAIYDLERLEQPLSFDFGKITPLGFKFHTWSYGDVSYAAEIRIAFEGGSGFWSLIGTQSTNHMYAGPGQASMNLEGFSGHSTVPQNWRSVVFHEFGHALGLRHEHQHSMSECGAALRLNDAVGYELTIDEKGVAVPDGEGRLPGVLTLLEHAPNYWSRADAQHNLQQLKQSNDLDTSTFDPDSIMRYEFAEEWYRDDAPERCLPTGQTAMKPSKMDLAMVAKTYRSIMQKK